jgi:hypothetical protein
VLNSGHESARRLTVYDVLFTIRSARVGRPGLDGSRVSRGNVDGRTMPSLCPGQSSSWIEFKLHFEGVFPVVFLTHSHPYFSSFAGNTQ